MQADRIIVILHTQHYEASVDFYTKQLGMKMMSEYENPKRQGMILAASPSIAIELYGVDPCPTPVSGLELSIEVEDVDAWHAELEQHGVEIARAPQDNPWGDRSFGLVDPNGVKIWFFSPLPSDTA
ncbi:MAG: VOC family protein [Chloroflexi bacterium]|nr:VOC family protein [Chloroflexota bacterium]